MKKKFSLSFLALFGSFLISQSADGLFDCNCNCGNGNIHNGSNTSNPVESSKALHQFAKKQTNDGLFDCNCNCNCGNGSIHNGSNGSGVGNGGGQWE